MRCKKNTCMPITSQLFLVKYLLCEVGICHLQVPHSSIEFSPNFRIASPRRSAVPVLYRYRTWLLTDLRDTAGRFLNIFHSA